MLILECPHCKDKTGRERMIYLEEIKNDIEHQVEEEEEEEDEF